MELSERKKKILQAIVEEYIDSAEPVSSGYLLDKCEELNCYVMALFLQDEDNNFILYKISFKNQSKPPFRGVITLQDRVV